MNACIMALRRATVALLIAGSLLLAASTAANAQGKGRGGRVSPGARQKAEKSETPRPPKPAKPAKPMSPGKERHRARKACIKDCKRAHKQAILACRGETGSARAACERAANQAHRNCMHGCR